MKLLSFLDGKDIRYGAVVGDGVVDLSARLGKTYASLRDLIEADALAEAAAVLKGASADRPLKGLAYALPIANARQIMCAGRNYRAYHEVIEDGSAPKYPSIFGRFLSSFAPHGEAIQKPKVSDQLDYEGELVAIIGKPARHVSPEKALDHVAGYTVMNEGTVRDWAKMGTQNLPSKNFHRSGGIGPWMVTADEIADPMKLHITTRRNGSVVQDGGTDLMIFDVKYLISHISKFARLEPGDMIATGSPGGSIVESQSPQWLKDGDVVEVEVSSVGTLSNKVVNES
jgi:2-keto-4-pentenoate hydratase/2-oxohepta-3-ene-1,7-dioic acid hydratase in catechol pathway